MTTSVRGERGRDPRLPREAVVRLRCSGRTGINTGFLKNVSAGGMFLHLVSPEPAGTRLQFEINVEGGRRSVGGLGEVAWSRQSYEGPGRPAGMAVRFLSLEPGARELVEAWVQGRELPPRGASTPLDRTHSGTPPAPAVPAPRSADLDWESEDAELFAAERSSRGRRRGVGLAALAAAVAVVAGLLLGGLRPEEDTLSPPVAAVPAQQEAVEAAAVEAPVRSSSLGPRPGPEQIASRSEETSAGLPPLTRVTDVRWERGRGVTVVIVEGDGRFAVERAQPSYIRGEAPRVVLAVVDVQPGADRLNLDVGTEQVLRVRTGYHRLDPGGDLHVVIDLASPAVEVVQLSASGNELLVYLGLPATAVP